ncbi:MAG: EamA family transporter [Candidatus Lokiarchaeota archaeon]|nr:EamA family transporter [Candidatus Lokiarchaeota archaeon]MBD3199056.1 EamA family transporter [Candidatus Lokiarchaeota archaeon]
MIGIVVAILANLTFVGSNAMFRKVEDDVSPAFINMFRTATGLLTFFIIALVLGILPLMFSLPWTLWIIIIISFVFGQVIGDTFYFNAQKELGTTKTLAVSMTFPFFTFLLDLIFLERPFDLFLIPSAVLISFGIIIISRYKIKPEIINNELLKDPKERIENNREKKVLPTIYAIIASLGWAIGLVMIDYGTNEINNILATENLSSIIGNLIRFPFALLLLSIMVKVDTKNSNDLSQRKTWSWLIVASLIGTSLGIYFFTEAARIAGASVMSLISTANPLFALPISYALNRERISIRGFIGVILTIVGVVLIII